jgi:hypothetical protein
VKTYVAARTSPQALLLTLSLFVVFAVTAIRQRLVARPALSNGAAHGLHLQLVLHMDNSVAAVQVQQEACQCRYVLPASVLAAYKDTSPAQMRYNLALKVCSSRGAIG